MMKVVIIFSNKCNDEHYFAFPLQCTGLILVLVQNSTHLGLVYT